MAVVKLFRTPLVKKRMVFHSRIHFSSHGDPLPVNTVMIETAVVKVSNINVVIG